MGKRERAKTAHADPRTEKEVRPVSQPEMPSATAGESRPVSGLAIGHKDLKHHLPMPKHSGMSVFL